MCKSYDRAANEVTKIVKQIRSSETTMTLDEIYRKLEEQDINSKMYAPGFTIKEYLEDLVSVGAIERHNAAYTQRKSMVCSTH